MSAESKTSAPVWDDAAKDTWLENIWGDDKPWPPPVSHVISMTVDLRFEALVPPWADPAEQAEKALAVLRDLQLDSDIHAASGTSLEISLVAVDVEGAVTQVEDMQ